MPRAIFDDSTAVLFPGQGSQTQDMRADLAEKRPDLIELATEVDGEDPFDKVGEGTQFQQPAIFCASLASWGEIADGTPGAVAGHSLGELTALTAAGVMTEEEGLRLVAARGRLMQEAALKAGETTMLAVRSTREQVEPLLGSLGLTLANDNAPEQVVLAGPTPAIENAAERLRGDGIRSVLLPVAGAFHSPAMQPAAEGLAAEVARISFSEPSFPVYSCLSAAPFEDVGEALVAGLTRPVRWLDTLRALHAAGITRFIETAPGKVLTGLAKRSLQDVETLTAAELQATHA